MNYVAVHDWHCTYVITRHQHRFFLYGLENDLEEHFTSIRLTQIIN